MNYAHTYAEEICRKEEKKEEKCGIASRHRIRIAQYLFIRKGTFNTSFHEND
jgi:hypothetical protein